MNTKEKIAVMQAFDEGQEVEYRIIGIGPDDWLFCKSPEWNWDRYNYRIKPNRKLYLWRYQNALDNEWYITQRYTERFPPTIDANYFVRLPETMIEVD